MPDLSVTADEPCEHHYKTHILGGHPLHVAICTLCRAIDWAELAEQAAELRKPLENRLRLAHQARRAKEHQLDGIRRALCDVGVIEDDDPHSHADLADVIRQTGDDWRKTAAVGRGSTEAAGDRVRRLHANDGGYCAHCMSLGEDYVPWPCPTIRALNNAPEEP